jgi:hypothetical protein
LVAISGTALTLAGWHGATLAAEPCTAAGMAIDPGYCIESGDSVLDARLAFGRSTAAATMGLEAYERLLEENKGAVEIIRAICATEPDEIVQRQCVADALTDRIAAIEERILAFIDERLPVARDDADEDRYMTLPSGSNFASFLAGLQTPVPQAVFASPRLGPGDRIGDAGPGTRIAAIGIHLAADPPGSVFRILWQHGTVAWTSTAGWNFDPALLRGGHFNQAPSFDQSEFDEARQDCLAAARRAVEIAVPVTVTGPFAAGDASYYMRVAFTDVVAFDCIAAPDRSRPASIAATQGTAPDTVSSEPE